MDREQVAAWMEAYRAAGISNDPAEVAALFTEDAEYGLEAFAEPFRGREEIVRKWTAGISQQVDLTYEVLAVDGDVAVVHWHVFTRNAADPVRTEYDGVLDLSFAADGRCRRCREWYFQRETS